jgi:hypothetical protein
MQKPEADFATHCSIKSSRAGLIEQKCSLPDSLAPIFIQVNTKSNPPREGRNMVWRTA